MPFKEPGKAKVNKAAYYQKNKDRIVAYHAEYQRKNRGRIAAQKAEYYREHRGLRAAQQARYHQEHRVALRVALRYQFYDMYGLKKEGHEHGICSCPGCGADLVMFGTISHVNGDGAQHRRAIGRTGDHGIKLFKDALSVYNPTRFAAECYNCNCAAERNGGICPHKIHKEQSL